MFPYAMTPQLFLGGPDGRLADVTAGAGPPFQRLYVGRGLAVGDLDNDGRLDAVMVAQNEPLVFFHNRSDAPRGHFIVFRLQGTRSNRDAVGARVVVHAGGRERVAVRLGGGASSRPATPASISASDPCDRVERVAGAALGRVDRYRDLAADRGYCCARGTPRPGRCAGPTAEKS